MENSLFVEIEIDVRFSETDAMGVVWHGNFLKFFEDAREAFGHKYGIPYLSVSAQGLYVPIVKMDTNFKSSVYYGQKIRVTARYRPTRAAKIIFEYEVLNLATGEIAATGSTTQVFIDQGSRQLQLITPQFFAEWKDTYKV